MKNEAAKEALDALIESGIDLAACLPDSAFKELYEPLSAESKIDYIQVANEGDGVGICMGAWLGGKKPALLMENTGFGVTTYALMRGPVPFGVPMLLLIAHRGGFHDQRWFSVPFGWGTEPLLDAMRIMLVGDAGAAPKFGDHDQQLPIGLFDHLTHIRLRRRR